MGQGARKVPRQFPLIFRISNRSDPKVRREVEASRRRALGRAIGRLSSVAVKAANGIVTLAKEAESESVQLRAWRAVLADQMAVSKFSDLEYRMVEPHNQDRSSGCSN